MSLIVQARARLTQGTVSECTPPHPGRRGGMRIAVPAYAVCKLYKLNKLSKLTKRVQAHGALLGLACGVFGPGEDDCRSYWDWTGRDPAPAPSPDGGVY